MENPAAEIPHVIHLLCQSKPSQQRATLEKYFTPTASFNHPFCRTGSFNGSRWLIWCIYRWYKIMSPRVDITVDSVAYDDKALILYVSMHQVITLFIIPVYSVPVSLVTVLRLVRTPSSNSHYPPVYLIKSQNDLYQVNEFVKFFSVLHIVHLFAFIWQFIATAFCVLGALIFTPISWLEENVVGGNAERGINEVVNG